MKARNSHFDPGKAHHRRHGFRNPPGSPAERRVGVEMAREVAHFMAQMRNLIDAPYPFGPDHVIPESLALKQYEQLPATYKLSWLGHACFLVTLNGVRILTDPFLSLYAAPLPLRGTRRSVATAVSADRLDKVDIIVISHNHYDHLDSAALNKLARLNPRARVLVPLGLKPLLAKCGFAQITELDWWDSIRIGAITIEALPAVHTSKRGIADTNRTLWCGFRIADPTRSIYFAGDTAYGEVFKQIGRQAGPFDLGLVPIGAYQPRKLMKSVHCTPEEAIRIGADVGAAHLVGMHWGTIRLSIEPMLEPRDRFLGDSDPLSRQVMRIGETIGF